MPPLPSPSLDAQAVQALIDREYPQLNAGRPAFRVTDVSPGGAVLRLDAGPEHLRPGNTVSGPTLFTLADVGLYVCALSHQDGEVLTVTTNLSINFMRKAEAGPLEARCRILKLGRSLMVAEAAIAPPGSDELVAHAVGTYSMPPKRVQKPFAVS